LTPELLFRVLGDRWLRLAVLLLVLAALAQQLSLIVWQLVPIQEQAGAIQVTDDSRGSVNASANKGVNYQQQAAAIGNAYLFGKAEVREAAPVKVEEAPETQLNYKLRGTYYSPDDRLSVAIIEVKPNQSRHYVVGEELDDKITLTRIEEDFVLLNRYGKIERLNLEKRGDDDGQSIAVAEEGINSRQASLLQSYKKRYASNPMALATRFQAIPVQQDGKNIGFKLKALRGERLLQELDFEPDDIFTAVNGVSLENPFEALDALKSLTTADRLSVTFLRNGAEQTLDIQI
jgi:type II secretion system protein C